jgi:putative peptide zinc metalloprotease protein
MAYPLSGGDALSPPAAHDCCENVGTPALPPDVRIAASPRGSLVYRPSTGLVARVGAIESEVLRRLDGRSYERVRDAVERDCGVRFTTTDVAVFAQQACAAGLLERPGAPGKRSSRRRGLSWRVALWNPERLFAWCARRASVLFHPLAVTAGALLILMAALLPAAGNPASLRIPAWHQILIFLLVLNLVSILHEGGHGIALHRYGGSAREIGVRFILGWPCWYCDITESYLLPRLGQRLSVVLAGPFAQAVSCAVIVLAARGTGPQIIAFRRAATLLGLLSALNFFPLIRSDGYYLLAELVGLPNLGTDGWRWLTSSRARQRMRIRWPARRRVAVACYGLASAAFMALVLMRAVQVIGRTFAGPDQFSIRTVEAVLSCTVILTMVARRRNV